MILRTFCFILLPFTIGLANCQNNAPPVIPLNCAFNCSNHGTCLDGIHCECDFGYSSLYCEQNWLILYNGYRIVFCVLFGLVAIVSFVQLLRFLMADGCSHRRGGIQKLLHILFFIMGIGRIVWLWWDPHNLKGTLDPVFENLSNSLGIFVIVFSYLLVVMLWSITYSKASRGRMNSPLLRFTKPVLILLIIFYGIFEIVLRVLWREVDPLGSAYHVIIYIYCVVVLGTVSVIMVAFLFFGVRMYWNLAAFEGVQPLVKERLRRITSLTLGATILCIATFICVLGFLLTEVLYYRFDSMVSFLIEQIVFRFLEIILVSFIMYYLRRRTYNTSEEDEKQERKPLLEPEGDLDGYQVTPNVRAFSRSSSQ